MFEKVWGESPRKMKVRLGPLCLSREVAGVQQPYGGSYSPGTADVIDPPLVDQEGWEDLS